MNHRLLVLAAFVVALTAPVSAADAPRPNILWISVEDIGPHLGCYGYAPAITPTLDELATRGIRYDRAFTTCPVCATNRSSIITGIYPSTLGSQHMRCEGVLPPGVRCFPEYLREAGYYCTNNVKEDYNLADEGAPWDESSKKAHWRGRAEGQPFFAVFNYTNTHESQIWPRGDIHLRRTPNLTPEQRQDPDKLTPPPYYPNTTETRRDWANYLENITQVDYYAAKLLRQLEEDGLADSTVVIFWSDHGAGLPRAKRWPYDSGLRVPMIAHVPEGLRGSLPVEPGTVDSQIVSFIDLAPTVLRIAGIEKPSHMQGRSFLGPDQSPPREYAFSTRDRMDERIDLIRSVRDRRYRYLRNFMPEKPYKQRISFAEVNQTIQALRRLDARGELPEPCRAFMAESKPVEELYDLQADPHELVNLAVAPSPEHQQLLQRFRGALSDWQERTRDLGFVPEPLLRDREEASGLAASQLEQERLGPLLAAVGEMTAPDAAPSDRQEAAVRGLSAEDAAIRCWAVQVLGALSDSKTAKRLEDALSDDDPTVQLAAAGVLMAQSSGSHAAASQVLLRELAGPNEARRLYAANALDAALQQPGQAAPAVIAGLERALSDEFSYVARVVEWTLYRVAGRELEHRWQK